MLRISYRNVTAGGSSQTRPPPPDWDTPEEMSDAGADRLLGARDQPAD